MSTLWYIVKEYVVNDYRTWKLCGLESVKNQCKAWDIHLSCPKVMGQGKGHWALVSPYIKWDSVT